MVDLLVLQLVLVEVLHQQVLHCLSILFFFLCYA